MASVSENALPAGSRRREIPGAERSVNILGPLVGVLLLSVVVNALAMLRLDFFWQQVTAGLIIITSVAFYAALQDPSMGGLSGVLGRACSGRSPDRRIINERKTVQRQGQPIMRTKTLFAGVAGLAFIFPLILFSSLSFANYYDQGGQICEDFESLKRDYESGSKDKDTEWQMVYASCLVIKGEVIGDQATVQDGLARLNWLVDHSNDVPSAFFLGEYYDTDGTFDTPSDKHIDKAIHYYLRTLELISLYPEYPWEPYYRVWEAQDQMELKTSYYVPMRYFKKFVNGAVGSYRQVLLESNTYTGDRNLNTWPEHSPYTEASLKEVVEHANFCLALPMKPHFDPSRYPRYKKACQVLIDMALKLQSMEKERLHILAQNHCRKDLENGCPEYDSLAENMIAIINSSYDHIENLINPPGE